MDSNSKNALAQVSNILKELGGNRLKSAPHGIAPKLPEPGVYVVFDYDRFAEVWTPAGTYEREGAFSSSIEMNDLTQKLKQSFELIEKQPFLAHQSELALDFRYSGPIYLLKPKI